MSTAPGRGRGTGVRVARVLLALALLLLAALEVRAALLLLIRAEYALAFPYQLDYGEGPLLDQALRLAALENIYPPDLSHPPYTIANYPPLFVALQAPLVALLGPAFSYGRVISLLCTFAAAALIGITVHVLTRDRVAALVSGVLLLAFPYVVNWAPLARVDALALALSWAALFVIVRWPAPRWSLVTCALLLVAAAYAKQSYVLAAPLAAAVWLAVTVSRRRALQLVGLVAGLGIGTFLLLVLLTRGGFYFHVVVANVNDFDVWLVWKHAGDLWEHASPLLLAGACYAVLAARAGRPAWWLVTAYLVGSVLAGLAIGKVGSNVNYLLELCAALALSAGALLAWLRPRPWYRLALVLLLAMQVQWLARWLIDDFQVGPPPGSEAVLALIRQAEGPVLTDEYIGLLPLAGERVHIQPFEMTQLARAGLWDQQPFVAEIEQQRFAAVVLFEAAPWLIRDRWTDEMLAALRRNYRPAHRIAQTMIYTPARATAPISAPGPRRLD